MESPSEIRASLKFVLLASVVTLVLWFVPFADVIAYPIRLFVTLIHEAGHALAALGTWGKVNRIALDWTGSGVTETVGGAGLLISSAGYLSTTLYGAGLLLLLRRARHARAAAAGTGVLMLAVTILFGGNLLAWVAGLLFGVGCLLLALKVKTRLAHFVMSFVAVQSLLNAFYDLRTLIYLSTFSSSAPTDAHNMEAATSGLIPAIVWAIGWSLTSMIVLAATVMIYYRSLRSQSSLEASSVALLAESDVACRRSK
jgi:hypothetical protein